MLLLYCLSLEYTSYATKNPVRTNLSFFRGLDCEKLNLLVFTSTMKATIIVFILLIGTVVAHGFIGRDIEPLPDGNACIIEHEFHEIVWDVTASSTIKLSGYNGSKSQLFDVSSNGTIKQHGTENYVSIKWLSGDTRVFVSEIPVEVTAKWVRDVEGRIRLASGALYINSGGEDDELTVRSWSLIRTIWFIMCKDMVGIIY